MTITKQHNGSIHITHLDDNDVYHSKVYYGYSRKEAVEAFQEYLLEQEVHEYIDAKNDTGFVTCNGKGQRV